MSKDPNNLIWVDLEMTGLDVESQAIIEISVVITDKDLKELARYPKRETGQVIYQPASVIEGADDWVKENVGAWKDALSSSVHLAMAEEQARALVDRYCPVAEVRKERCPLAGNSIGQDRKFLERYMPRLERYTSYRNVDVTTIKELVKRWYPEFRYEKEPEDDEHDTMKDILASIEELRYYRDKIFVSKGRKDAVGQVR